VIDVELAETGGGRRLHWCVIRRCPPQRCRSRRTSFWSISRKRLCSSVTCCYLLVRLWFHSRRRRIRLLLRSTIWPHQSSPRDWLWRWCCTDLL